MDSIARFRKNQKIPRAIIGDLFRIMIAPPKRKNSRRRERKVVGGVNRELETEKS